MATTHAVRKHENATLRLLVTLIHLSFWAQLGVLTRIMLDKFFQLGCAGSWGPCPQNGAYFKDLPSNMLGSFVIGLFAASSTVGLAVDKPLAALPAGHTWQHNFELQIGIRTGYCGSLTTFASWNLELMVPAITQNKWADAAFGYLVGLFSALVCYVMGMHMALWTDSLWDARRTVLDELAQFRQEEVDFLEGKPPSGAALARPSQALMMEAEPDLPRLMPSRRIPAQELEELGLEPGSSSSGGAQPGSSSSADGAAPMLKQRHTARQQDGGTQPGPAAVAGERPKVEAQPLTAATFRASLRTSYRTDAAVLVALVVFTALLGLGVGLETRHEWLRQTWMCCLLGPFGCVLRWLLSKWNYKLGDGAAWFPAGTFAANMLGTGIDFLIQSLVTRDSSLGYWGSLMTGAVITGFCGSLTTVSTFVTEVVKFADAVPDNFRAYTYALLSLGGGILLGLALYGWSVWAY